MVILRRRIFSVRVRRALRSLRGRRILLSCSAVDSFPAGASMIELTHLSGSLEGKSSTSDRGPLRIGRAPDCEIRFDSERDRSVSNHHAEIVFTDGAYHLIDTGSTNGTIVNGRKVVKHRLAYGDRLRFGEPDGPEAMVRIDLSAMETADV